MTEADSSKLNPYEPPKSGSEQTRSPNHCPVCNEPMEHGFFRTPTPIRWFGENAEKKLFNNGVAIPHKKEAISIGLKYPGHFCAVCMLTILDTDL